MFISKKSFQNDKTLNLELLDIDYSKIMLTFKRPGKFSEDSKLRRLNFPNPFKIMVNEYTDFTKPCNADKLKQYIFVGLEPANAIEKGKIQGYRSNYYNKIEFENCDGRRNSYFAFFPNIGDKEPVYKRSSGRMFGAWMKGSRMSSKQLPEEFYYFMEEHFGGCGAQGTSDQLGLEGVALGFYIRYDLTVSTEK